MIDLKEPDLNYALQVLLDVACDLLRNIFRVRWKLIQGRDWDAIPKTGIDFVNGIGRDVYKKLQKKQKDILKAGDIDRFDITTLVRILQAKEFDTGKQSEIQKIAQVRNDLAHHPKKTEMKKIEFDSYWETLSKAVISLGYSEDKVKEIYERTFQNSSGRIIDKKNTVEAQKLKNKAQTSFTNGDYQLSVDLLSDAIRLPYLPDHILGDMHANRSTAYLEKCYTDYKIIQLALYDAKQAVIYHRTWNSYYCLGCVYEANDKFEKAIIAFARSLELDPSQISVINAKDRCLKKKSRIKERDNLDTCGKASIIARYHERNANPGGPEINPNDLDFNYSIMRMSGDPFLISEADVFLGLKHIYFGLKNNIPMQSYVEAAKLFTKASYANNAEALYNLGILTKFGKGVEEDIQLAVKLFERAATQPTMQTYCGGTIRNVGVAEAEHELGLCFANGLGVEKNLEKARKWYGRACEHELGVAGNNLGHICFRANEIDTAVKHWKIAACRGIVHAMESLEMYYRKTGDMFLGKYWWQASERRGDKLNNLYPQIAKMYSRMPENLEGYIEYTVELQKEMQKYTDEGRTKNRSLALFPEEDGIHINMDILKESAANGSITAQQMVRAFELAQAGKKLISDECNMDYKSLVHDLAEAYKADQFAVRFRDYETKSLIKFVLKKFNEVIRGAPTDFEKNLRICYLHLCTTATEELLAFVTDSIQRFPDENDFRSCRGSILGVLGKCEEYLAVVDEDFKKFPNHLGSILNKAVHLNHVMEYEKSIRTYIQFLNDAPHDHRRVPEIYYTIAIQHLHLRSSDLESFKKYFQLGLNAEKLQLSCFIPYECKRKKTMETFYKFLSGKLKKLESIPNITGLIHPLRVEIIVEHRESIKMFKEYKTKGITKEFQAAKAKLQQRVPRILVGLKPITLSEMNFTKDHVYEGFVLKGVSIEDVATFPGKPSISLIIQDENGDTQRCAMYNIPEKDREKFGFGSSFTILNPYMRMAMDFKPAIRVDDPKSVFNDDSPSDSSKKCRFCFSDNAMWTCNVCKKVQYCSKICQSQDWKLLQHKIICTK